MNTPIITKALMLAHQFHEGQFRRDGTTPYINHVIRVVANVKARNGTEDEIVVAWLHDLVEDTTITLAQLLTNFPSRIVDAVDALTHRDGESYEESIERAKANPIARNVKIADNLANLSDCPTDKQIRKYSKSLQTLMT